MDKLGVGRAQLGTALDLFIRDRDPISVQALAAGGCSIIDGLAEAAGSHRMVDHVRTTNPQMTTSEFYALRNQYWNAIKHVSLKDGQVRDDAEALTAFQDTSNDIILFVGWYDYMLLTKRLPIEAQVFQIWWYAMNPDRLAPDVADPSREIFPDLHLDRRDEQKRRLARAVEKYRKNEELIRASATEREPISPRVSYLPR